MASQAPPAPVSRYDARTIVGGGVKLGGLTAALVVAFALVSRALGAGALETLVQGGLILVGGAAASYLPAHWVRPYDVDTIGWASLLGLLGALTFTVIDTAALRPLALYHWTWDAIGGGSGFWYIAPWWIGATVLAWLGSWVYVRAQGATGRAPAVPLLGVQTMVGAVVLAGVLLVTGVAPFHASIAALAYSVALILHVPAAKLLGRR